MIKKTLSILLAIIILCTIVLPAGIAYGANCEGQTSGDCPTGQTCEAISGTSPQTYHCVPTQQTGSAKVYGPSDCIKIRQDLKLQLTVAGKVQDVTIKKDAIIARKSLPAGECKFATDAINTACNTTDISSKCYLERSAEFGVVAMFNTLYTVTNWVFYIMTVVAVLMIVFGGFTYLTAAGDPGKAGKGKGILMYAIIGLAIALIAKIIPSLVRFILGL